MAPRPKISRKRRQEILEAAVETIVERGVCGARIADVAARTGTSAALVLYYFESKDRLLTEALAYAEDRFYLAIFGELSGLETATDKLVRLIELSSGHESMAPMLREDFALWIELWSRALRDEAAARKRAAGDRRWRGTIADIVREGQSAGEFDDIDVEDFAMHLACLLDGVAVQHVLGDPQASYDHARRIGVAMASRYLGFAVREPATANT
ncbi:MAG TPA: TetR/AcrR family transcriptional regulator [Acidobacteriota bacterium]|nr:TetR/AcrR family transcriptional regulator [Acidobacteriota bacterium]